MKILASVREALEEDIADCDSLGELDELVGDLPEGYADELSEELSARREELTPEALDLDGATSAEIVALLSKNEDMRAQVGKLYAQAEDTEAKDEAVCECGAKSASECDGGEDCLISEDNIVETVTRVTDEGKLEAQPIFQIEDGERHEGEWTTDIAVEDGTVSFGQFADASGEEEEQPGDEEEPSDNDTSGEEGGAEVPDSEEDEEGEDEPSSDSEEDEDTDETPESDDEDPDEEEGDEEGEEGDDDTPEGQEDSAAPADETDLRKNLRQSAERLGVPVPTDATEDDISLLIKEATASAAIDAGEDAEDATPSYEGKRNLLSYAYGFRA